MTKKTVIIVTHNSNEINVNSNIIHLDEDGELDDSVKPVISSLPDVVP
jgi:ATP-binding cassette subfamily B protein/subfamily B ATP-binding cassette protein MsbA